MTIFRASVRRYSELKELDLIRFIRPSLPLPTHSSIAPCTPKTHRCYYFTNTDQMKKSDPFARLGLEWGATATEIKAAYRRLARELHPDVSRLEPAVALDRFRLAKEAYDKLMNNSNANNAAVGQSHRTDLREEWSFAIWRNGDIIAQERTDVAGEMRKRPAKPAESMRGRWGVASLGHPDGRGASSAGRGEFLSSGDGKPRRSSTVGNGNSKWVQKKEFRPWNPEEGTMKGASRFRKSGNMTAQASAEKTKT
mmetsp:Transcript_21844/g.52816  ORF Transcript_21844/g.52816 Transcript_21844/m.52816 type:complete len:253 (+) Transcript_21844:265-1023(+)